jgi:TrmH family RNA methyltransferase
MNEEIITSRENQRLKEVRRIREGKLRELLFVEGVRLCEEVLRSPAELLDCYYTKDLAGTKRGTELLHAVEIRRARLFQVSGKAFDSIADTKSPQGIVVVCRRPSTSFASMIESIGKTPSIPVVIFLDRINNPSNLGAIARTAEAAGAVGLITSPGSTDIFSPKSLRASMGALLRLNVLENVPLPEAANWATSNNLITCAADGRALHTYTSVDWTIPRLLLFGSEAHGIDERYNSLVKEGIRIPMKNNVESLNVAVSSGILLFEAVRQNELKNFS